MKRIWRILSVVVIVVALVVSIATPVLAISTSPTKVQINNVYAYENCLQAGDLLLWADFTVTYAAIPTEPISTTFILRFVDSSEQDVRDSLPYAYFQNGYSEGLCAIYFNAANVISEFGSLSAIWTNLFSGINYYMRLDGNPSAIWTGGGSIPQAPQIPSSSFTPKVSASMATTQIIITQDILTEGNLLQTVWNNTSYILVANAQVGTTYGAVLTAGGETYFGAVLPSLSQLAPNGLSTKQEQLDMITTTPVTNPYSNVIGSDFKGSALDLTASANALHIGGMWLGIILTLFIDGFVSIQASREVNSYKPFILLNIPLIYVFTRIGWFPMLLTVGLGLVAAVCVWYCFFYEKTIS